MKKLIALVLISCIALGCATAPQTASLECAGVGAAGAFALCKLLGGDDTKCAVFTVLTGIGGGAICYSYASDLQKRKQELAGKENDLGARLRDVRKANEDSTELNQELRTTVAQVTQHTDEVVVKIRDGTISQQQLAKEREALANEEKRATEEFALAKNDLEDMKRFQLQQTRRSQELDAEIAKQQQLLAEAQRYITELATQRLRVG